MSDTKAEWFFIINPRAGSGKTMQEWLPAEKKIKNLEIPFSFAFTDHRRHAIELAGRAAGQGYRKIAAVGGDGTLHEVFNGLLKWCEATGNNPDEFTLGVMPIGSGNDWIKTLDVPRHPEDVVDLMAKESTTKMDVVKVRTVGGKVTYMANVGGLGFDSHVSKRVNIQKSAGHRSKMIYIRALRYTIRHMKSFKLSVTADGKQVFSGDCYSIAMGNGKYSGGGLRQVPDARIDDGLLDFTIVPKLPILTIFREMPRLMKGTLNQSPYLVCGKCRELQVMPLDTDSQDIIEIDGEIQGRIPMTVTMTGRQIRAICGSKVK